jgi:HAD superfamily hydrolase (TIGR01509 family)
MTIENATYGVIWDFDGTLVDTMPTHFSAWQKFMAEHSHNFSEQQFWATSGKSAEEILKSYFKDASTAELARLGDLKNSYYREAAAQRGIVFAPGAQALLETLQQAGFKQAIGSGTPRKNLELAYRQYPWLAAYFQAAVVAGDTPNSKPDPSVFLVAARKLELAPHQCLVIEDGLLGIEAARRAGMASVAVITGDYSETEFLKRGAARVVKSLVDLEVSAIIDLINSNAG